MTLNGMSMSMYLFLAHIRTARIPIVRGKLRFGRECQLCGYILKSKNCIFCEKEIPLSANSLPKMWQITRTRRAMEVQNLQVFQQFPRIIRNADNATQIEDLSVLLMRNIY